MPKLISTHLSRSLAFLLLIEALASIALVSGSAFAQAPPGIPMIVTGSVTLNGSPAPDGLNLTAWDNSKLVGSTTTSGGNYTVEVCGQAGQTCSAGDTISFQLAQLTTTQTTTFVTASPTPVTLNLAFTGTPVTPAATSATTATTATTTSTPISEYGNTIVVLLATLAIAFGVLAKRHSTTEN